MTGSPEEREIRDAVATYARAGIANCRIIHELVVGSCRADLAAVTRDRLVLFEIKSQKDRLDRLANQVETFTAAAHAVVIVAHIDWFDREPYQNGSPRLAWPSGCKRADEIWCYPEPTLEVSSMGLYKWRFPRQSLEQPRTYHLLNLLWNAELFAEANRHRISTGARSRRHDIITQMCWLMTGREIAEAVCRQLRLRGFPEADPPMGVA